MRLGGSEGGGSEGGGWGGIDVYNITRLFEREERKGTFYKRCKRAWFVIFCGLHWGSYVVSASQYVVSVRVNAWSPLSLLDQSLRSHR